MKTFNTLLTCLFTTPNCNVFAISLNPRHGYIDWECVTVESILEQKKIGFLSSPLLLVHGTNLGKSFNCLNFSF